MRKNIVAGNWKMNGTQEESRALATEVCKLYQEEVNSETEVVMIPPFIGISLVQDIAKDSGVKTGAQNCNKYESGAYTGEVSAKILASWNLDYVIVGHSERREYFEETNALLAEKVGQLHRHRLSPIYCCGETLEEREENKHFEVIENQITEGLFHLTPETMLRTVIAYEPVWAIGTGKTASSEEAQEIHAFIRGLLKKRYGQQIAEDISILYGGSVKPGNAPELFAQTDIDGGLIGGAALNARDFIDIAKSF